ncbi:MAG: STAS domain-containing protein [bacterium]
MEGIEIAQGKVGARRDIAMLTVKGYVDTMTCSILLNKITENLNSGHLHIIVDMAQVNYVSSAGWGVFVGEIKGIRERGGDLKIVQMTPEVYDVFEMLEFNRILSYYETVEEAINDFDLSIGLDITKSVQRSYDIAVQKGPGPSSEGAQGPAPQRSGSPSTGYMRKRKKFDPRLLPLTEKVKQVVIEDPTRGAWGVRRALRGQKYGGTKVNIFKVYGLLRKLNLDSKEKRYRFYRSR